MRNLMFIAAVVGLAFSADSTLAQGQNTITWAANFPAVVNAGPGQNMGAIEAKGGFTKKAGWFLASVAVQYIPNPAPGGAPVQGVACDVVIVAGNEWGKENRAFPGGPVIGVIPKSIPLAVGKYQVWAMGAFEQNPPAGGWPGGVVPANARQFIITNIQNIEIKAAPNQDPGEE